MSQVTEKPEYELTEDGDVLFNRKGKSVLLAKYFAADGERTESDDALMVVQFESDAVDYKYRPQIIRAIIETAEGAPSGKRIDRYAIKGREADKPRKGEPPRPKALKLLGDKTPDVVKWYFKWRPQEAYVRYQVLLDANLEPKTAHCIRAEQGLIEPPDGRPMEIKGSGKEALSVTVIEKEEGMLARRQTCMTFLVSEIVGEDNPLKSSQDDEE